jgi:predicted aconitase with swiveling domain
MAERTFQGRMVAPGTLNPTPAVVSRQGVNTLASFQKSVLAHKKQVICSDQNNPDLYNKNLSGTALCLPQTIGSTTGGMILYAVCDMGIAPAALLFAQPIDSLAAAGVVLADVWSKNKIVAVDRLGEDFLTYVQDGMEIAIAEDGTVTVVG